MQANDVQWNAQYDVVVVGFGGAGATAARFAADAGAYVLLVDTAPLGREGGNTRYASQHVAMGKGIGQLTKYYQQLNDDYMVPAKLMQTYLRGLVNMPDYFEKYLGVKAVSWKDDIRLGDPVVPKHSLAEYPELADSESVDIALVHRRDKDAALWKILRQNVVERADRIDVWLNTRARHLYQDERTGVVKGVQLRRRGKDYRIAVKNGLVLATGGFENNREMIQNYLQKPALMPMGTLFNRGDGIKMAQEVQAKLWHMGNYESYGTLAGLTFAEEGTQHRGRVIQSWSQLNHGSIFVIGDDGTRFFAENQPARHGHLYSHGHWVLPHYQKHPYLVFDQAQYEVFAQQEKDDRRLPYPKFMQKLLSADSLPELAKQLHVPAISLTQTVTDFNHFKEIGRDYQTGRDTDTMRKFGAGPYYAIKLASNVLNTQGGPQHDEKARVLNVDDQPIPHLYSAGELGGIAANYYQSGGNLAECLIFGKIAGENAAKPKKDAVNVARLHNAVTMHINDLLDLSAQHYMVGPDQYLGVSDDGMGGRIVVRVTYQNQKLRQIEILENHENEEIGQAAFDQLEKNMISANTPAVDAISGATTTSRALSEAVADALSKVSTP